MRAYTCVRFNRKMKTNATIQTIKKAVRNVSERYENNIIFKSGPKSISKNINSFAIRTKDSSGPGSRLSKTGRKFPAASWQVFGEVMEEVHKLEPNSWIITAFNPKKKLLKGFKWEDAITDAGTKMSEL